MSTIKSHYLDYYCEWSLAMDKVKQNPGATWMCMRDAYIKGDAFTCIMHELLDADRISSELAAQYITEVHSETKTLENTFLN